MEIAEMLEMAEALQGAHHGYDVRVMGARLQMLAERLNDRHTIAQGSAGQVNAPDPEFLQAGSLCAAGPVSGTGQQK